MIVLPIILASFVPFACGALCAPLYSAIIRNPWRFNRKLVLDMDDTIYSGKNGLRDSLLKAIQCFIQHRDGRTWEDSYNHMKYHYLKYGLTVKGLVIEDGIDPRDYEAYLSEKVDYELLNKDDKLIKLLKAARADIVIFTNSGVEHTTETLEKMGILEVVDAIIFTDYNEPNFPIKPEAEAYERVERLLGVSPSEIFFVDDSADNVRAAKNRGWNVIRIKEDSDFASIDGLPIVNRIHQIPSHFPSVFPTWNE